LAAAGGNNRAAAFSGTLYAVRQRGEGRMGEGLARALGIDKRTPFHIVDSFGQRPQPQITGIELWEGHFI
jgi:hypothetical protein